MLTVAQCDAHALKALIPICLGYSFCHCTNYCSGSEGISAFLSGQIFLHTEKYQFKKVTGEVESSLGKKETSIVEGSLCVEKNWI